MNQHPAMLHEEDASVPWVFTLTGQPDPLALSRTLQKAAVPTVRLLEARFLDRDDSLWMELTFRCTAARARLLQGKLQKLVWVDRCAFRAESADGGESQWSATEHDSRMSFHD